MRGQPQTHLKQMDGLGMVDVVLLVEHESTAKVKEEATNMSGLLFHKSGHLEARAERRGGSEIRTTRV
jgi:hypothetical protein